MAAALLAVLASAELAGGSARVPTSMGVANRAPIPYRSFFDEERTSQTPVRNRHRRAA